MVKQRPTSMPIAFCSVSKHVHCTVRKFVSNSNFLSKTKWHFLMNFFKMIKEYEKIRMHLIGPSQELRYNELENGSQEADLDLLIHSGPAK